MVEVTGKEIWKLLKADADSMDIKSMDEVVEKIFQEYVENQFLESVLDMVNEPVTIASLVKVKVSFVKGVTKNGLVSRMINSMPKGVLGLFDAAEIIEMTEDLLLGALDALEDIAKDVAAFLRDNNVTEQFVYEQMGVSSENIAKAIKGELFIRDILLSQPAVIIQITSDE